MSVFEENQSFAEVKSYSEFLDHKLNEEYGMKSIRIISLLVGVIILLSSFSSPVKFSFLTIKDGLSQSSVKCIHQDSDGYLWFGTADGLNKFDGYKFTIYHYDPNESRSIAANEISCIYENPYDSVLWIGTKSKGLAVYNKEKDNFISFSRFVQNQSTVPPDFINDILATKDDKLWFATREGVCFFNSEDSSFIYPDVILESGLHNVNCLETDKNGNLWLGTSRGLFLWSLDKRIDEDAPEKIELNHRNTNLNITTLKYDIKGNLFIGTGNQGLFKYNPVTKAQSRYVSSELSNSISSSRIRDILQTRNGDLWIGTMDGLCKLDVKNDNFEIHRNIQYEAESLNNDVIYSLYEDLSGIIWIGTYLGGINKIDPIQNRFSKYNNFSLFTDHHSGYNDIRSIFVDDEMSTWVGTSKGLLKLEPDFFTSASKKDHMETFFEERSIGNLLFHEKEGIFISTGSDIVLRDKNGNMKYLSSQINQQTGLNIQSFSSAIIDSDNDIWFATNFGLLKYKVIDKSFSFITPGMPDSEEVYLYILAIEEDLSGALWIGTFNGELYKFDRNTETFEQHIPFKEENMLVSFNKIFSIHESSLESIWLGTNLGLYEFNPETSEIKRYLDSDGLSNNVVYGILEDNSGNIWCSTNNGISVFNIKLRTFTNFSYEDGLQSNEFNQDAYYKSQDGTMYLGGVEGLNIFNPDNLKYNTYIPSIRITGLQIHHEPTDHSTHPDILDKQISKLNELRLSHKQSTFSFEFTALSFSIPARNSYEYMLENYDENWIDAGNSRIASYTHVPPGNYIFKVKGANCDGLWNETPASIKVIISPPFWNRTLFKLLLFVAISFFIYLFLYFRFRNIKISKAVLEKNVLEKTQALSEQNIQIEKQNEELLRINEEIINQNEDINLKNSKLSEQHEQIIKQRDNLLNLTEQIKEVNQTKLRFFTSVSHEIRTPLTLIIGPLNELVGNIEDLTKNQLKRKFETIYGNASKLLIIVNQLLDFRKVETDNMKLKISRFELVSFVQQIAFLFNEMATVKHINFSFISEHKQLEIWADNEKIEKIIYNLLSNAFKFTHEGGQISLSIVEDASSGYAVILVKDTGEGIEEDNIPYIFERFYQQSNMQNSGNTGSGLGLALAKKYIEMHQGKIEVESTRGKGSSFIVKIPLGNQHIEGSDNVEIGSKSQELNRELIKASISDYMPVSVEGADTSEDLKKPVVLLIEDDKNLGGYLKDVLSGRFRVIHSDSGEKGFSLSKKKNPDIIISDVMLPGMNGFEFCVKVKSEFKISHIPIIMLTSLADHESHMKGIKSGADAFITKPFDLQQLILTIENLIEQRKKLQLKFTKETTIDAPTLFEGTEDKEFLIKIISCVESNLSDTSFNVDKLCTEIGLSQPQVYRKVKALTNLSISEFIRNIRLKKGSQLLLSHKFNINEVAYEVGFNDPNYFTKCFIKLFKMTPSEYVKTF